MFRQPSRYYSQKRQNGKISFRFTETQWNHREKEGTNAEYEELISRMSRKIVDGEADEIWISKFDLDYAYGQLPLSENAMDLCIFPVTGGNFTGYYRFLKGFYGLAGIPTIFQEKIDKTLENKHPALLDDVLVVTKDSKQQHKRELIDVLTNLENAGYRLSENKTEFFRSEKMVGTQNWPKRD